MSFHRTKWQNALLKQRQAISWANSFCRIWHKRDKGLLKEKTWSDEKSLYLFIFLLCLQVAFQRLPLLELCQVNKVVKYHLNIVILYCFIADNHLYWLQFMIYNIMWQLILT